MRVYMCVIDITKSVAFEKKTFDLLMRLFVVV